MTALTSGQKTSLRKPVHYSDLYLAVLVPEAVFVATVDNDEARGATSIEYTAVSGADTDVEVEMVVYAGTSSGDKSIGVVRVKAIDTGSDVLTLPENDLDLASGNYLTILKLWLPQPRLPTIDNSGTTVVLSKDGETYTDENEEIPPVVVMGPPECQWIDEDAGYATCKFVDEYSYSFLSGVTISSAVWDWDGGSETGGTGTVADPYVITYAAAGTYWVKLTVTDSNGKASIGRRPVFIFDDNNLPYVDFTAGARSNSLEGTRQSFVVFGDADFEDDWPDETIIVRFNTDNYGGVEGSIENRYPFRGHIKFVGYLLSDSTDVIFAEDRSEASFEAVGILEILKLMPGFGNVLKDRASPSSWAEMIDLDSIRAVYYIIRWHTTALTLHDYRYVLATGADEILIKEQRWGKDSIFTQTLLPLTEKGFFANLGATIQGSLEIRQDPSMMATGDRSAIVTVLHMERTDYGEISFPREPRKQVQTVRLGGFSFDGGSAIPYLAKSPGVPANATSEMLVDGIILSAPDGQSGANRMSGDLSAKVDNILTGVDITLPGNWDVFEAALQECVTFDLAANENVRGLVFDNNTRWIIREVSVDEDVESGLVTGITLSVEKETDGVDGVTIPIPEPGDRDWPEPARPRQPRSSPSPSEDPDLRINDYVIATNKGVFGIDITLSSNEWVSYNRGLSAKALLFCYDFKKDPFHFESSGRVWLATNDGIWRMDGFPGGVWEQIITISDMEVFMTFYGDPYRFHMSFSSEIENLFCFACGNYVTSVNHRGSAAFVVLDDTIINGINFFVQGAGASSGWPRVAWGQHSGGQKIFATVQRAPGRPVDAQGRLWRSDNRGGAWSLKQTIPNSRNGRWTCLSVPYNGPENVGDDYGYWGIGGDVLPTGIAYSTEDAFDTAAVFILGDTTPEPVVIGTGGHFDKVWVCYYSTFGEWSIDGGGTWVQLPSRLGVTAFCSFVNWLDDRVGEVLVAGTGVTYLIEQLPQGGSTWVDQTLNLPDFGVTEIYDIEKCQIT